MEFCDFRAELHGVGSPMMDVDELAQEETWIAVSAFSGSIRLWDQVW